jgi:hypothetical protein
VTSGGTGAVEPGFEWDAGTSGTHDCRYEREPQTPCDEVPLDGQSS